MYTASRIHPLCMYHKSIIYPYVLYDISIYTYHVYIYPLDIQSIYNYSVCVYIYIYTCACTPHLLMIVDLNLEQLRREIVHPIRNDDGYDH